MIDDKELIARLRDFNKVTIGDARVAADRIEDLEAKLAQAVEALDGLLMHEPDYSDTLWQNARATIAEIKKENGK